MRFILVRLDEEIPTHLIHENLNYERKVMSQKKAAAKKSAAVKATDATEPIVKAPRKQKTDRNNLYTYLNRLLKSVQDDAVIRKPAIEMLNTIALGVIKRIVDSSVNYIKLVSPQTKTLNSRVVKGSVYAMLPGVLRDVIIANAEAALQQYNDSVAAKVPAVEGAKKKGIAKHERAGLVLSDSRVKKIMRGLIKADGFRSNEQVSIFLTAVVEQLIRLILPGAIEAAKTLKRDSVGAQAIVQSVKSSPVLTALYLDWLLVAEQEQEIKKEEKKQKKKKTKSTEATVPGDVAAPAAESSTSSTN